MRMPRDVSGDQLAKLLAKSGYEPTRQTGSHIRLTRQTEETHHITIPRHAALNVGTLNNILKDVAEHLKISKNALMERLWGR